MYGAFKELCIRQDGRWPSDNLTYSDHQVRCSFSSCSKLPWAGHLGLCRWLHAVTADLNSPYISISAFGFHPPGHSASI